MRALAMYAAFQLDLSEHHADENVRKASHTRAELLIPVVKGWCTELGNEMTAIGVQVHGGMGFIEETGAAQYVRDARITTIYEGTTGIQANDLLGRKMGRDRGAAMAALIGDITAELGALNASDESARAVVRAASDGVALLRDCTQSLLQALATSPDRALAVAVPYLMLTGYVLGGWLMAKSASIAASKLAGSEREFHTAKLRTTLFYAQQVLPRSSGLASIVKDGGTSVTGTDAALISGNPYAQARRSQRRLDHHGDRGGLWRRGSGKQHGPVGGTQDTLERRRDSRHWPRHFRPFEVGTSTAERAPLKEVLQGFFDGGGRLIDTSPMYSTAEGVLGDLMTPAMHQRVFLATKVWTRGEKSGIEQMTRSAQLMKHPKLDLIQVHNLQDLETHLRTLRSWKEQGRVRHIGITHYTVGSHSELARIIEREKLDFVQLNYSAGTREAEQRLLPLAADRGVAVLVNRPFEDGALFDAVRGKPVPSGPRISKPPAGARSS